MALTDLDQDQQEHETNLLNVIAGAKDGEYVVLANWYDLPVEPEDIRGCFVAVESHPDRALWEQLCDLDEWVIVMRQLDPATIVGATVNGNLICMTDETCYRFSIGLEETIADIYVCVDGTCLLAHDNGISVLDGRDIISTCPTRSPITAIDGRRPDALVAVGQDGLVLRFDGSSWNDVASSPTDQNLVAVFCRSDTEIYIGGWDGTLFRWNGKKRWKRITLERDAVPVESGIVDIAEFQGEVYVGAGGDGLYKITGKTTELVQTIDASRLTVLHGKLIVTGGNMLYEFDGHAWSQIEIDLSA